MLGIVPARPREDPIVGGLMAGQAVLDLDGAGTLAGLSVLEERRLWPRRAIGWELPGRASPHLLVVEGRDGGMPGLRWDAERKLFGLVWADAPGAQLAALGPRAWAATDGERLVGLLADLRGFEKA